MFLGRKRTSESSEMAARDVLMQAANILETDLFTA